MSGQEGAWSEWKGVRPIEEEKRNKTMRIAAYLRLSKEDGSRGESDSIRMQRMQLFGYAKTHLEDYEWMEFADDGYTGTHLDRPGIKALLERVKQGEVDCVIVKDFSRFSRDYIELGVYIRQIFPFLGVRFISVNDQYDSGDQANQPETLDIAFRHLLYDLYSKDLSVKVKASLEERKAQGMYASSRCPFGYEKAAGDRHALVIAEDEAAVVRRIFAMAGEGLTSSKIARQLNEEGIKTPAQFKREQGKTARSPRGEGFFWRHSLVCSILRNPFYTGDFVYGKYEKGCVGGKSHSKPKSEWKVIRGHHEAIVERELFEAVQPNARTAKEKKKGKSHFLAGKLVCGGCRGSLAYRGNRRNPYFYCCNRYVNRREGCVEKLNAMYADEVVRYRVQEKTEAREKLEEWREDQEQERGRKEQEDAWRIQKKRERIRNCQRKQADAYERYADARKRGEGAEEAKARLEAMAEAQRRERSEMSRLEQEYEDKRKNGWESEAAHVWEDGRTAENLIREIVVRGDEMEIVWVT